MRKGGRTTNNGNHVGVGKGVRGGAGEYLPCALNMRGIPFVAH